MQKKVSILQSPEYENVSLEERKVPNFEFEEGHAVERVRG